MWCFERIGLLLQAVFLMLTSQEAWFQQVLPKFSCNGSSYEESGITCVCHQNANLTCTSTNSTSAIGFNETLPKEVTDILRSQGHGSTWERVTININGFSNFSKDLFVNVSTQHLELSSFAPNLEEKVQGLLQYLDADNLKTLTLINDQLKRIPISAIAHFHKLRTLDLSRNEMVNLTRQNFTNISPNLTQLNLTFNRISFIDSGAFQDLSNLEALYLGSNRLVFLESEMFKGLDKLKTLVVDQNRIQVVENILLHLTSLSRLSLRDNLIASFSLIKITSNRLTYLSIQNNSINEELPHTFLEGLPKLKIFYLDYNQIKSVSLCSSSVTKLIKFPEIQFLQLSNNAITRIDSDSLSCLSNLRKLDLSGNSIDFIADNALLNMTKLQIFTLENNGLTKLACKHTSDLVSLITINLKRNGIREIEVGVFEHSEQLSNVYLEGNKLDCNCFLKGFSYFVSQKQGSISFDSITCFSPPSANGTDIMGFDFSSLGCPTTASICESPYLESMGISSVKNVSSDSTVPASPRYEVSLSKAEYVGLEDLELEWHITKKGDGGNVDCFVTYFLSDVVAVSAAPTDDGNFTEQVDCSGMHDPGNYNIITSAETFDNVWIYKACFIIKKGGAAESMFCTTDTPRVTPSVSDIVVNAQTTEETQTASVSNPTTHNLTFNTLPTIATAFKIQDETTTDALTTAPLLFSEPSTVHTTENTKETTILLNHPSTMQTITNTEQTTILHSLSSVPASTTISMPSTNEIDATTTSLTNDTQENISLNKTSDQTISTTSIMNSTSDLTISQEETTEYTQNSTLPLSTSEHTLPPIKPTMISVHPIILKLINEGNKLSIQWKVQIPMPMNQCNLTLRIYRDRKKTVDKSYECKTNSFNVSLASMPRDVSYAVCLIVNRTFDVSKQYCSRWHRISSKTLTVRTPDILPKSPSMCPSFINDGIICQCIDYELECRGNGDSNTSDALSLMKKAFQINDDWMRIVISIPSLKFLNSTLFQNLSTTEISIIEHTDLIFQFGTFTSINNTLQELHLQGYNVTRIPSEALIGLHKLKSLILSGNEIVTVKLNDLKGLYDLTLLDLRFNTIQHIENGAFHDLRSLKELYLQVNALQVIDAETFQGLISLKELNLEHNRLQTIILTEHTQLKSLETLFLNHNDFKSIKDINITSDTLKNLQLQNNELDGELTDVAFENTPNLKTIDLSYNKISGIKPFSMCKLKSLKTLDLSHNKISHLPDHAWACLSSLSTLALSDNLINRIDKYAFSNMTTLRGLDLERNKIVNITCEHTADLLKLEIITLKSNQITTFGPGAFRYSTELSDISILDNQLHCDCQMEDFQALLKSRPLMTIFNSRCSTPTALRNVTFSDVDFSRMICPSFNQNYCISPALKKRYADHITSIKLNQSLTVGVDLITVYWNISSGDKPAKYICQYSYVQDDGQELTYPPQNCTELSHPGSHIEAINLRVSWDQGIAKFCLAIYVQYTEISKNCSENVPQSPFTIKTTESPEIPSTTMKATEIMTTEENIDDVNVTNATTYTEITETTIQLSVTLKDQLEISWFLSTAVPPSACKVRLVMYEVRNQKHRVNLEKHFNCDDGSYMLHKPEHNRIVKVCVTALLGNEGISKNCTTVPAKKLITVGGAVVGAPVKNSDASSGSNSHLYLPLVILACLLALVMLIVVAIVIKKSIRKKRRQQVSTIEVERRARSPRARLFSRSSGSYDLTLAIQRGSYHNVRESNMVTVSENVTIDTRQEA